MRGRSSHLETRPRGPSSGDSRPLRESDARLDVAAVLCLLSVFAIPLVFERLTADSFSLGKLALLGAVAPAVTFMAVVNSSTDQVARRVPAAARVAVGGGALVAGWAALATLGSISPEVSILGAYRRYDGLIPLVLFVSWAAAVHAHVRRRPRLVANMLIALAAGTTIAAVYTLLQAAGIDFSWFSGARISAPQGTQGNSGINGGHLAIGSIAVLSCALDDRHPSGGWWSAACVVCAAALVTTGSETGMVAALASWSTLVWTGTRAGPLRWSPTSLTVATAVVVAGAVLLASTSLGPLRPLQVEGLTQRLPIWQGALRLVAEDPLLGSGPGTFSMAFPRVAPTGVSDEALLVDSAHDTPLHLAATLGAPAALAWIVAFAAAIFGGARTAASAPPLDAARGAGALHRSQRSRPQRSSPDIAFAVDGRSYDRGAAAAWVGVTVAYVVQALGNPDTVGVAFLGWTALGVTAASISPAPGHVPTRRSSASSGSEAASDAPTSPRERTGSSSVRAHQGFRRAVPATLALVTTICSVVFFARLVWADVQFREVFRPRAKWTRVAAAGDSAHRLNPWEPTYLAATGARLNDMGVSSVRVSAGLADHLWSEAWRRYSAAVEMAPGDFARMLAAVKPLRNLATLRGDPELFREADSLAGKATRIRPQHAGAHVERAKVLAAWAELEGDRALRRKAQRELQAAQEAPESTPSALVEAARVWMALDRPERARGTLTTALRIQPDNQTARRLLRDLGGG